MVYTNWLFYEIVNTYVTQKSFLKMNPVDGTNVSDLDLDFSVEIVLFATEAV